jgi:hypothetical protein
MPVDRSPYVSREISPYNLPTRVNVCSSTSFSVLRYIIQAYLLKKAVAVTTPFVTRLLRYGPDPHTKSA